MNADPSSYYAPGDFGDLFLANDQLWETEQDDPSVIATHCQVYMVKPSCLNYNHLVIKLCPHLCGLNKVLCAYWCEERWWWRRWTKAHYSQFLIWTPKDLCNCLWLQLVVTCATAELDYLNIIFTRAKFYPRSRWDLGEFLAAEISPRSHRDLG